MSQETNTVEEQMWRLLDLPLQGMLDVTVVERRRYRMLAMNAYVSVLMALPFTVAHLVSGSRVLGLFLALASLGFLLNLNWIRKHENAVFAGLVAAVLTLASMGAVVKFNGGFFSPSMDLLQLTPLLAVAVWGHRTALYTIVATATMMVWFWGALPADLAFDAALETGPAAVAYRLATLLGVVLLLEIIEFERQMGRRLVQHTRGALSGHAKTAGSAGELVHAQHLATLAQLALGVGHELNTPLAAAMGQLELAMDEEGSGKDPLPRLNDANEALQTVARLVEDLRMYSLHGNVYTERVDLREAATVAMKLLENDLRHRAVLHVDLQPGQDAPGDTAIWTRIFVHFLSSAGDAIEPGNAAENEIRMLLRATDDGTELVIEHTGPAPPEGALESSVETPSVLVEGEGLGFFLNRVFVTNLGGTLTAESRPASGQMRTRMWIPAPGHEHKED